MFGVTRPGPEGDYSPLARGTQNPSIRPELDRPAPAYREDRVALPGQSQSRPNVDQLIRVSDPIHLTGQSPQMRLATLEANLQELHGAVAHGQTEQLFAAITRAQNAHRQAATEAAQQLLRLSHLPPGDHNYKRLDRRVTTRKALSECLKRYGPILPAAEHAELTAALQRTERKLPALVDRQRHIATDPTAAGKSADVLIGDLFESSQFPRSIPQLRKQAWQLRDVLNTPINPSQRKTCVVFLSQALDLLRTRGVADNQIWGVYFPKELVQTEAALHAIAPNSDLAQRIIGERDQGNPAASTQQRPAPDAAISDLLEPLPAHVQASELNRRIELAKTTIAEHAHLGESVLQLVAEQRTMLEAKLDALEEQQLQRALAASSLPAALPSSSLAISERHGEFSGNPFASGLARASSASSPTSSASAATAAPAPIHKPSSELADLLRLDQSQASSSTASAPRDPFVPVQNLI